MSTAKTPANIAGNTTNAAATTTLYTQLSNASANLNSLNTQTEWVSGEHVGTAESTIFNTDLATFYNPNDQFVLNSAAYTLITLGATPFRITYAPTLAMPLGGQRLRVHADINLDAVGLITLPNILTADQDCFFLQLWYREGSGAYFPFSQEWGFSVTNMTDTDVFTGPTGQAVYATRAAAAAMQVPRRRFKCSITGFLGPQATGVDRIEVRARLANVACVASATFEEAVLTTVYVRN